MLYDSFVPKQRNVTGAISLLGLAVAAVLTVSMWGEIPVYQLGME